MKRYCKTFYKIFGLALYSLPIGNWDAHWRRRCQPYVALANALSREMILGDDGPSFDGLLEEANNAK